MEIKEEDLEKVYKVEFITYEYYDKSSVHHVNNYDVINNANELLVRESELDKYKEYGDGYRSIQYVGMMPKISCDDEHQSIYKKGYDKGYEIGLENGREDVLENIRKEKDSY